jgi:hypothetical protein
LARKCEEEGINPWPPYVDIFSATILVLLLFMLVLYSIIAYNSQFISKVKKQDSVENKEEISSVLEAKQIMDTLSQNIKKREDTPVPIVSVETTQESSKMYEGGDRDGGVVSAKREIQEAKSEFNRQEMTIVFKNKDVFLSPQILDRVKNAINILLNANPNAKIELSVGDPKNILSSTMAKQISLGRVLNLKNKLNEEDKLKDRVEVKFSKDENPKHDYGHVQIGIK